MRSSRTAPAQKTESTRPTSPHSTHYALQKVSATYNYGRKRISIPLWIIYVYTGLAVAAILVVVTILVSEQSKCDQSSWTKQSSDARY